VQVQRARVRVRILVEFGRNAAARVHLSAQHGWTRLQRVSALLQWRALGQGVLFQRPWLQTWVQNLLSNKTVPKSAKCKISVPFFFKSSAKKSISMGFLARVKKCSVNLLMHFIPSRKHITGKKASTCRACIQEILWCETRKCMLGGSKIE
jgi:hypothetical protein